MYRQAVCHVDYESLRDVLGLPENCSIISVDKLPHHVAGGVGLRIVMESTDFPETAQGESIPLVNLGYESTGSNHRKFLGFQPLTIMVDTKVGADDG